MDTVFSPTSSFQKTKKIDKYTMQGPGITDMKGGLLVMLAALKALEQTPWARKIGWEVLINPDEEVGSTGSEHLFVQAAKRCHYGLIFEPAFPDGTVVSQRKGSANMAIVVRGRAAHAGRDFYAGRNAIAALSRFIVEAEKLCSQERGVTVNIGRIEGGGPVNIVPDLAIGHFNIRVDTSNELTRVKEKLEALAVKEGKAEGISLTLHTLAERCPKPFDEPTQTLFQKVRRCAGELDMDFSWKPSGGVCDGNILSSVGLPTIDTLGVIGGNIHTQEEYIHLDSLTERACLTALFLMKFAAEDFT
jgi:glutamate carboxypeptidase